MDKIRSPLPSPLKSPVSTARCRSSLSVERNRAGAGKQVHGSVRRHPEDNVIDKVRDVDITSCIGGQVGWLSQRDCSGRAAEATEHSTTSCDGCLRLFSSPNAPSRSMVGPSSQIRPDAGRSAPSEPRQDCTGSPELAGAILERTVAVAQADEALRIRRGVVQNQICFTVT